MTPPETIGSTLGTVAAALGAAGFDEARRRARRLLAAALGMSQSEVFTRLERMISEDEGERVAELLARVVRHEPISRILGVREFWGLGFELSPDTLDPRPESETVVEAVLARRPDRAGAYRILDLGTGTGCLLLALLSELPAARGIGVDCAPGAVETSRRNADRLGLAARAEFVVGDWAASPGGLYDIVVANPPYIASGEIERLPPEVRDFDPRRALDGGGDGLDAYRAIAVELPSVLAPEGLFVGEFGQGQECAVSALLIGAGLTVEAVLPDLAGIARCVVAHGGREKTIGSGESPA
jgi:release factor glutamine methyltransferase